MTKPDLAQAPDFSALDRIRVVLSHTSHPGNIGAAARAMKTMGLSRLYLVNPKHFPDPQADALASGATDVLASAVVVSDLASALAGTTLQAALTARRRELTLPLESPRQLAPSLLQAATAGEEVALVFGTEMSGLTIDEVRQCNRLVTIPANPVYSSLNLGQAVQVLSYELRQTLGEDLRHWQEPEQERASHDDVERFYSHLESTLIALQFLNPAMPKRLMPRLRRLFARSGLEKVEVDILRGILRSIDQAQPQRDEQEPV